jgi:hypothetical protein
MITTTAAIIPTVSHILLSLSLTQAVKLEIIRLVEESDLPVKQTLAQLGIGRIWIYLQLVVPGYS